MCCIPCAEEEANSKLTVVEEEIKLPEATYYSFKVQDNSSGLQFTDSDNFRFKRSEFQTIDSVICLFFRTLVWQELIVLKIIL